MFTVNNNTVYYGKRDKFVDDYNSTRHSSKKMTPVKACKKMRVKFILIYTEIWSIWKLEKQSLILEIEIVFQSMKDKYLIKDILQIGQKRFLWLTRF